MVLRGKQTMRPLWEVVTTHIFAKVRFLTERLPLGVS